LLSVFPEMVENVQVSLKIHESSSNYTILNDKMNDLYGFMFAVTNFLCPIIGGYMQKTLGTRTTYDVMWIVDFGFCIILIIFNCGPSFIKDSKTLKLKLKQF